MILHDIAASRKEFAQIIFGAPLQIVKRRYRRDTLAISATENPNWNIAAARISPHASPQVRLRLGIRRSRWKAGQCLVILGQHPPRRCRTSLPTESSVLPCRDRY